MILIFSVAGDEDTNIVIKHLISLNKEYLRINKITSVECHISNILGEAHLAINKVDIPICSVSKVFFRRQPELNLYDKLNLNKFEREFVEKEEQNLWSNIVSFLKGIECLSTTIEMPKLAVLLRAKEVGFNIPNTFIRYDQQGLFNLVDSNHRKAYITKCIGQIHLDTSDYWIPAYTTLLDKNNLSLIRQEGSMGTSLVQEKIDVQFEIRAFVLHKEIFSVAIFNNSVHVDFREEFNRQAIVKTPFDLPQDVRTKVLSLMSILELNTGSIDLIYSAKGEFVFLELNPNGQIGMCSAPGNYHIHEKIAMHL